MFKRKLIETLKRTINNLEDELVEKKAVIKNCQEENTILLENSAELRAKITDLENNIKLLVNNSRSKKVKELVNDDQSLN